MNLKILQDNRWHAAEPALCDMALFLRKNTGYLLIRIITFHQNWHQCCVLTFVQPYECGPGSSVCIATDYGLDGTGSNPGDVEIFRPSRPALGPTQPPVKWVPSLSRGKVRPGLAADHLSPSSATVMEE